MTGPPQEPAPTTTARAILRYWLSLLRHEEASQVGLEAQPRPPAGAPPHLDLMAPARSGGHVELPLEGPRGDLRPLLTRDERRLDLQLDAGAAPLFHAWLYRQYRREYARNTGRGAPPDDMLLRFGFPVLRWRHRRRPHVAPLLHLPVADLAWFDAEGGFWKPPTYRDRKRGRLPVPPTRGRVRAEPWRSEEEQPALGLDVGVLRRVLRMDPEHVADALRVWEEAASEGPEAVIRTLTEWLGGAHAEDPVTALSRALVPWARDGRAEVGLGALLYDGAGGSPTAMLQDELRQLQSREASPLSSEPLRCYLLGEAPVRRRGVHVGLRSPSPLTAPQRAASEWTRETSLTAVQGPPGTGKTHLILEMAAHALVEAAREGAFTDQGLGSHTPLLVTSVNNRAVDNVVDALTTEQPRERLPFALRVGSRAVLSDRTVRELDRVVGWLTLHDAPRIPLDRARRRFEDLLSDLDGKLEPLATRRRKARRVADVRTELRQVEAALADLPAPGPPVADEPPVEALRQLQKRVHSLEDATEALYDRVEEDRRDPEETLRSRWEERIRPRALAVADCLEEFPWEAPDASVPSTEGASPADALFARLERMGALRDAVDRRFRARRGHESGAKRRHELQSRRDALLRELRACEEAARDDGASDHALRQDLAAAEHEVFLAARDLREAWAATHRERLLRLVRALRGVAADKRDWKVVLDKHGERRLWAGLFPVMGGTLLSLAHVLPLEPDVVRTVVVDEAGQCPPPHVVPALYRARRAAIVGDVHQLEPVVTIPDREERALRARLETPVPEARLAEVRVVGGGLASAQRLAERAFDPPLVLEDHYRCQEAIIGISGRLCGYRFRVHTPPRGLGDRVPWLRSPVALLGVQGRQREARGSWDNPEEAARVVAMVHDLITTRGIAAGRVAVLTPYRGQARRLWRDLRARGIPLVAGHDQAAAVEMLLPGLEEHAEPLMLGTIHGLQGGERDVVVLSTVATEPRSLGWLNRRPNLVNVAVSRARLHLVTVGDPEALREGRHTRELVTSVPPEGVLT
ncbi:MAG: DEAD/DEAH box helicase [Myxococcota bacterium]